jgi:hypothetical protein
VVKIGLPAAERLAGFGTDDSLHPNTSTALSQRIHQLPYDMWKALPICPWVDGNSDLGTRRALDAQPGMARKAAAYLLAGASTDQLALMTQPRLQYKHVPELVGCDPVGSYRSEPPDPRASPNPSLFLQDGVVEHRFHRRTPAAGDPPLNGYTEPSLWPIRDALTNLFPHDLSKH